jgi:hypothetical protein
MRRNYDVWMSRVSANYYTCRSVSFNDVKQDFCCHFLAVSRSWAKPRQNCVGISLSEIFVERRLDES